ncbi:hypothetical protein ABZZ17_23090 [Streptomyces sp. NPDC006512]|uniref:hypothetical protein n=1 Tax=Streptomyces sp. NPDC006512 TaxID=3154307 RepID=UPI0033BF4AB7
MYFAGARPEEIAALKVAALKVADVRLPGADVAEWTGNSVPVLLATYARGSNGQLDELKQRIESAGELPGPAVPGA